MGNKIFETVTLSKFSKYFMMQLAKGNSYQFCMVLLREAGFCAFLLSYNKHNLPLNLSKKLC